MILFLLNLHVCSKINISKVLIGNWNISKFQLTADGVEILEDFYLLLSLSFNEEENYIYGNINKKYKIESKNESLFVRLDLYENSTFSVKIKSSNNTQEYSDLILLKFNIGLDDMIMATGKTSNLTYSLNISPPSSAELTIFNQNTKQVNIYRLNKEIYRRKLNFNHIAPFITTLIYTSIKFLIS